MKLADRISKLGTETAFAVAAEAGEDLRTSLCVTQDLTIAIDNHAFVPSLIHQPAQGSANLSKKLIHST
jgi:hypothetical protein